MGSSAPYRLATRETGNRETIARDGAHITEK
jgi:hypothetical protein